MRRWFALSLALAVLCLNLGSVSTAQPRPINPRNYDPLILVMDTSGSMNGERLKQAKDAALLFIDNAAINERIGLFTYPGGKEVGGCVPGAFQIQPNEGLSAEDVRVRVAQLTAAGDTPTGPALQEIIGYLQTKGITSGRVVLISDGEANCGNTNICQYADELKERGIDLQISTVSFDNTETGNAQLKCLAESTGGTYTDAQNWQEAAAALRAQHSYQAELEVQPPDQLTGLLVSQYQRLQVTVRPTGRQPIPNAKLIVTFISKDEKGTVAQRRVWVDQPTRVLGELPAPGAAGPSWTTTREFGLRPTILADGEVTWTATLLTHNVPIARKSGTIKAIAHAEAGTLFTQAKHVVVLGDSYSSGEGAGDYLNQDSPNVQERKCHRSNNSYGVQLFKDQPATSVTLIACSGAVTEHFRQPQITEDGALVKPQLVQLADDMVTNGPPDLVLMTLGGNDAGFAPQISQCVLWGCNSLSPVNWDIVHRHLRERYDEVNRMINNPQAIAKRDGKLAQIVVVPYVDPLPRFHDSRNDCFAYLGRNQLALLKGFASQANATVRRAVLDSRQAGVPIQLADPVVQALQPDHQMCDPEPWIVVTGNWGLLAKAALDTAGARLIQELVHPNTKGHAAIVGVLKEWSLTAQPVPGDPAASPTGIRVLLPYPPFGFAHTEFGRTGLPTGQFWQLHEGGSQFKFNIGIGWGGPSLPIRVKWKENFPINVQLRSIPRPIGWFYANENGDLPPIPIPLDAPTGKHILAIEGRNTNGDLVTEEYAVYIWPEGASRALDFLTLAVILGLVGGALLFITNRRAHRSNQQEPEVNPDPR